MLPGQRLCQRHLELTPFLEGACPAHAGSIAATDCAPSAHRSSQAWPGARGHALLQEANSLDLKGKQLPQADCGHCGAASALICARRDILMRDSVHLWHFKLCPH